MRCVDVIRELSAPTGHSESSALAEHLSACPQCATWAARDAKLGRLWNATQPVEPSPAAWDLVWSRVSAGLDRSAADLPDVLPMGGAPAFQRGRRALGMTLGFAQAAAILLAVLFFARSPGLPNPVVVQNKDQGRIEASKVNSGMQFAGVPIDIAFGEAAVIRLGASGKVEKTDDLALNDNTPQVDARLEMLNFLEATAEQ